MAAINKKEIPVCPFFSQQVLTPVVAGEHEGLVIFTCSKFAPNQLVFGEGRCSFGGPCDYTGEQRNDTNVIVLGGDQTTDTGLMTRSTVFKLNKYLLPFKSPNRVIAWRWRKEK